MKKRKFKLKLIKFIENNDTPNKLSRINEIDEKVRIKLIYMQKILVNINQEIWIGRSKNSKRNNERNEILNPLKTIKKPN